MTSVRTPAVAGKFYPGRADELLREVLTYTSPGTTTKSPPVSAIGCIAPHAGYMYSGSVAGSVYSRLDIPERCVILCPNHTGKGRPLAIMATTNWLTPLGEVAAESMRRALRVPLPKPSRLADIKQVAALVAHQVNTGQVR